MAIPYQQGYSISPRYGFRYGPSSHVPATTDRYVIPDNNYIPPSSGTSTSGGASKQPLTMGTGSDESGDDNTFTQNDSMAKSLAKSSGYSPGEVNPLAGALNMIPVVGPEVSKQMGLQNNFGAEGTYDAKGNVFGKQGFAYDLTTGQPANSYKDRETFYNTRKDSYGKLRDEGYDPFQSFLGTYTGSNAQIPYSQQELGATPASLAGIDNQIANARHNTMMMNPDLYFTQPYVDGKPMMDFGTPTDYVDPWTGLSRNEFFKGNTYEDTGAMPEGSSFKKVDISSKMNPDARGLSGNRAYENRVKQGLPVTIADPRLLGTVPLPFEHDQGVDGPDGSRIGAGQLVKTNFGWGTVNESGQISLPQGGTVIQKDGKSLLNLDKDKTVNLTPTPVTKTTTQSNEEDSSYEPSLDASQAETSGWGLFSRGGKVPALKNTGGK